MGKGMRKGSWFIGQVAMKEAKFAHPFDRITQVEKDNGRIRTCAAETTRLAIGRINHSATLSRGPGCFGTLKPPETKV